MATPAGKPAAASPPPLPEPPASPVSGIQAQRKAIAPQLTETPKGESPEKAFAERQKAAIAKATGEAQKAQDEDAGEDAPTPPKGTKASKEPSTTTSASAGASTPATTPGKSPPPATAPSTTPGDATKDGKSDAEADATERASRYSFQSLKKWAEENPEDAAAIGEKLFKMPADSREEWIRLKNGARKVRQRIQGDHEKTMSEVRSEREAAESAKAAIDSAAGKLAPIADLWEAVAEKIAADPQNPQIDFEAADAAFQENAKISIDDYMRLRARRSVGSNADAVRMRIENQRLKRELAGKPSDALTKTTAAGEPPSPKEEAGTASPAAAAKADKNVKDWSDELPPKHKLRQFEGWNKLLDQEMRKYHDADTDEYAADPEEMANTILKREIERTMAELEGESEPAAAKPKPKASNGVPKASELTPKPRAAAKPAAKDDEGDDDVKVAGMTWAQRQKRAIDRAMARARGEIQ